jgi:hypothetical protein
MTNPKLAARLDALKKNGTIAGWQDRAVTVNYGLSKAPLPALIFPINYGNATTYYNQDDLALAVSALEEFGPMVLVGKR